MRTTVHTNPADPDEVDEFPGCHAMVEGDVLFILTEDDWIEEEYGPGEWVSEYGPDEWVSVETTKD